LINDFSQTLANHDKLGTKEKIEADMDKLKMQWVQLCDIVSASIESLQQELSVWFSSTYAQLEAYLQKSNEILQQIRVFTATDANLDDPLGDQVQSANALITDYYAVFSELAKLYLILLKLYVKILEYMSIIHEGQILFYSFWC